MNSKGKDEFAVVHLVIQQSWEKLPHPDIGDWEHGTLRFEGYSTIGLWGIGIDKNIIRIIVKELPNAYKYQALKCIIQCLWHEFLRRLQSLISFVFKTEDMKSSSKLLNQYRVM